MYSKDSRTFLQDLQVIAEAPICCEVLRLSPHLPRWPPPLHMPTMKHLFQHFQHNPRV